MLKNSFKLPSLSGHKNKLSQKLRQHYKAILTAISVLTLLLFTFPTPTKITTIKQRLDSLNLHSDRLARIRLARLSSKLTANTIGHMSPTNEKKLADYINQLYQIKITSTLEDNQLNHSVGYMGKEQHLQRYPGDTIAQHDEVQQAGIAPGRGAWGYFTYSKQTLTQQDVLNEKYYFAVQTLYLPNWNQRHKQLVPWYKYRKMLAINPQNGRAVVGVVADAGPAKFTGKHFGGSPEAMFHLKANDRTKMILLFIDDPNNQVPLGPLGDNQTAI